MEIGLALVDGGSGAAVPAAVRSLAQRLRVEDELRGRVALHLTGPAAGEMNAGVVQLVTVALASGGAGTVLVRVVADWLRGQRSHLVIKVSRAEHETYELELDNVKDAGELLDRFEAFVKGRQEQVRQEQVQQEQVRQEQVQQEQVRPPERVADDGTA
ncbi:effector-associated constant component EACC1 [Kitasatospora purpeofusca]|uniref:effector-associated constant component EACC1 n=1 Tax=Kitasatospora purpeofusca TaxID=67352 RepID=UPI002A5A32AA|nr:hypothetical protein [Kitasatospora purpeofusca]MDY0811237.1 hypothetical protein [Kitasatospora purpeofusca]